MIKVVLIAFSEFLLRFCFDCLDDFAGFDLNFRLNWIFLPLELLGTSNKLVGGCDKYRKMHFCCLNCQIKLNFN